MISMNLKYHLGPKGPSGKGVFIHFVHVFKDYKTRVGDRRCVKRIFVNILASIGLFVLLIHSAGAKHAFI